MRRFVVAVLAWTVGLTAVAVAFNGAVDPYGMFGTTPVAAFNRDKPQAETQPYLAKTYLVERVRPATLLLGNSRVQSGLDPESPAWPAEAKPVFNLGIGGADAYTSLRFLQHSLATARPKLVVIGVSLDDCQAARHVRADFESRLRATPSGAPNPALLSARIKDAAFALMSLTATADSVLTVLHQGNAGKSRMTPLGFNDNGDAKAATALAGHFPLFNAKEKLKIADALAWAKEPEFDLDPVTRMIALAREHGARVVVFISPGHAGELEIYRQIGVLGRFARWKKALGALVDGFAADGAAVALWDFASFSPYTTEPIPAPGDRRTRLKWFWEMNHFTPALGDAIIARMMGAGPADLGTRLTGAAEPPAEFCRRQRDYIAERPGDVARIGALVARAASFKQADDSPVCVPQAIAQSRPEAGP